MLKKVTDTILYVGANDHEVDLFEGQYVVPNGMAYNSYVILDEKVAVMDTIDQSKTAEWLKNTGIFVSENINGNGCFQPEKQVSRADFLTMLVGVLDIPLEENAVSTGFSDECADWLKPYLAAAMRAGLTAGWPEGDVFGAEKSITGAEAAVMLQNALDLSAAQTGAADDALPAWAADALSTLGCHGIELEADAILTRGDAAEVMYQISLLQYSAPGMMALRAAQ